jgi:uncharacterized membrane protein
MKTELGRTSDAAFLSSDRLASLSDTMFGVAMTLLAASLLPTVQALKGSAPEMLQSLRDPLIAIVLSFAISSAYWVSQQRRLAQTSAVTPRQTRLHLLFLFLIILVPLTTAMPGGSGPFATRAAVTIYGAHLTLIALVNLVLWFEVHRVVAAHAEIVRGMLGLTLFVAALAVGQVRPDLAQFVWFSVFATPWLGGVLTRLIYRS